MVSDGAAGDGDTRRARRAFLVLGVGLGAFVDGIVLHQILQWHHLVSDDGEHDMGTLAGLEANTLADGLFHLAAFVCTVVGIAMLTRAGAASARCPRRAAVGMLLVGWGAFNLVEGLVDHHLLTLHHVRDDVADPLPWDLGFLAISVLITVSGLVLARSAGSPESAGRPASPSSVTTSRG